MVVQGVSQGNAYDVGMCCGGGCNQQRNVLQTLDKLTLAKHKVTISFTKKAGYDT